MNPSKPLQPNGNENTMYLDDRTLDHVQVGYGRLGVQGDLGYENKRVRVQGKPYDHALSSHPPARLRFQLDDGFDLFECHVGINDDVGRVRTHADFKVLADGREVARASRVAAGATPRHLRADISGAKILELVVSTTRWEHCHAVWLEPQVKKGNDRPRTERQMMLDCLHRTEITLPVRLPRAERCIATIVTPGFEHLLDDMLGSLYAYGQCQDALVVVLTVGESPKSHQVIAKYGATSIKCRPHARINPAIKAALYSIARVVEADYYLCLDADTLILDDLRPIFGALEVLPRNTILASREGNGFGFSNLRHILETAYSGSASDIARLLGKDGKEGDYPLVVNDGVFAGRRKALLDLDDAIRSMDRAPAWVDAKPPIGWRNQFIFNLAMAHLDCGVELDATNNVQLHVQDVAIGWRQGRLKAQWREQPVRIAHFSGNGRQKYPKWRGLFAGKDNPTAGSPAADGYANFLSSLRAWLGRHGTQALTWSFYGTADAKSAYINDSSTFPLFGLLHYLIRSNGCTRVIETGTARGVSTAVLASAVAHRPNGRVVTMDINPLPARLDLWASLADNAGGRIEQRVCDSLVGMQTALANGERFDAALLDSLHFADHVWAEFDLARQLVCPGGLILIHDAVLPSGTVGQALKRIQAAGYGITRLWTADCGTSEDGGLGLALIENRRQSSKYP